MVVKHHGEVVADLPAAKLADEAPIYHREATEPEYLKETRGLDLHSIQDTTGRRGGSACIDGLAYDRIQELGLSSV